MLLHLDIADDVVIITSSADNLYTAMDHSAAVAHIVGFAISPNDTNSIVFRNKKISAPRL